MDYQTLVAVMAEVPALQNLDLLRQLIAEYRAYDSSGDDRRLRMLSSGQLGMNALTTTQDDR